MSSRGDRLDRVCTKLTVQQRASSVLTAWKKRLKPSDAMWSTASAEDRSELRRGIDRARAVKEYAPYMLLLLEQVRGLESIDERARIRRGLGNDIRALGAYIRELTKEPVTETEYRRREQQLREELVPIQELVEVAMEQHPHWSDADYADDGSERVLPADTWTRGCSEAAQELIELVRTGVLKGEDQATGIRISAGAFYDWLGEPMPVSSESAYSYEIFPDTQADEAVSRQHTRRMIEGLVAGAPGGGDLRVHSEDPWPDVASEETAYALLERLDIVGLREGIQARWREMRCFEIVLAELATKELNGEDPLRVETRQALRRVRTHLNALRDKVQLYAGDFEFPKPAPEDLALLRKLIARRAER